ncbi:MAG TPA: periplasmic heavy metal sensor [Stellaceae bacterium]
MILAQPTVRGIGPRQLLWVVLALSLALNLFFVVGAVWIRFHQPLAAATAEERLQQMAAELGLDPQQRGAFENYAQTMRAELEDMRQATRPLIREAWTEVAKPQADEGRVMQLLDQAAQRRRGFQQKLTTMTHAFLAQLSPEQRARFIVLARQRPLPWHAAPERPAH